MNVVHLSNCMLNIAYCTVITSKWNHAARWNLWVLARHQHKGDSTTDRPENPRCRDGHRLPSGDTAKHTPGLALFFVHLLREGLTFGARPVASAISAQDDAHRYARHQSRF